MHVLLSCWRFLNNMLRGFHFLGPSPSLLRTLDNFSSHFWEQSAEFLLRYLNLYSKGYLVQIWVCWLLPLISYYLGNAICTVGLLFFHVAHVVYKALLIFIRRLLLLFFVFKQRGAHEDFPVGLLFCYAVHVILLECMNMCVPIIIIDNLLFRQCHICSWVVILPCGSRNFTRPLKLELAIYVSPQVFEILLFRCFS